MSERTSVETEVFSLSDVGRVRDHNEDSYLVDRGLQLYVVADGMGGHAAGEVASSMAVRAVRDAIDRERDLLEAYLQQEAEAPTRKDILTLLQSAVQHACGVVHEESVRDPAKRGMGTTLEALLILGTKGFAAHVGDSRIYLRRHNGIHQLTEDHSVINELMRRGRMSPEQLANVGQKNAVTRALGPYPSVDVDVFDFDLLGGDRILICSDGLTNHVEVADLNELLDAHAAARAPQALVDLANQRGGKDNITLVLVHVHAAEQAAEALAADFRLRFETLKRTPFFRYLSYKETVRVLGSAEPRRYQAGSLIVREGEEGDAMHIVLSGRVDVLSGEATIAELGSGEHFGELALIDRAPRSASVRASERCETLMLRRSEFFDILRNDHAVAVKLLWSFLGVLSERLRSASKELGNLRDQEGIAWAIDEITGVTVREENDLTIPPGAD